MKASAKTNLSLLILNLTLIGQIALVTDKELVNVLASISVNLLQPFLNVVERLEVCDVVNDDDTVSTSVVGRSDGSEEKMKKE
jgi:NADH:ubiquinone oxidoreductase subunit K